MTATLDDKVKSWFETQTREVAEPTTPPSLASMIGQRGSESPAELALRAGALAARGVSLPPPALVDWVGGGGVHVFQTVGLLNTWQLMVYCHLQPGHRVLKPGCGCGRNARYLAPYLSADGSYDGFDIHRPSIDWASDAITRLYPNVRFTFANIANTNYNPSGSVRDSEYAFPYDSGAFDVVFLPSVFTHLTRDGFEHYAREIARVLAPGGRLLSWHFLLDDVSRKLIRSGRAALPFSPWDAVAWVTDAANPCAAIAFDEPYVLESLERAGLRPQLVAHGTWAGRVPDGLVDAQDRILAVKAA